MNSNGQQKFLKKQKNQKKLVNFVDTYRQIQYYIYALLKKRIFIRVNLYKKLSKMIDIHVAEMQNVYCRENRQWSLKTEQKKRRAREEKNNSNKNGEFDPSSG